MKQSHAQTSDRISCRGSVSFVQIATWASQYQIVHFGRTTFGTWYDVLDVKRCTLQALVHQAVLASIRSALPDGYRPFTSQIHSGCLPNICNASARTRDNCSLNSTKASNSSRS